MILTLPRRPANDNQDREVWTCRVCDNAAFLLHYVDGRTAICCDMCNEDVTDGILPTLPIGIDLCQP